MAGKRVKCEVVKVIEHKRPPRPDLWFVVSWSRGSAQFDVSGAKDNEWAAKDLIKRCEMPYAVIVKVPGETNAGIGGDGKQ